MIAFSFRLLKTRRSAISSNYITIIRHIYVPHLSPYHTPSVPCGTGGGHTAPPTPCSAALPGACPALSARRKVSFEPMRRFPGIGLVCSFLSVPEHTAPAPPREGDHFPSCPGTAAPSNSLRQSRQL